MPICQLAPDVAAKIAAGEVVERPASVVKELIENSIDAGASQIRVDLINGGLQLIRVTDNGAGIPADELLLALSRHATSKVAQIDDLEHIRSLGFRGEALASIAAVAEVVLISRPRGGEQSAQISASNGQIAQTSVAASPEGTILTVRNLFSAVPARLKFLKSRNTEVSHCLHLLEQYALAYPEIRFSVSSEGRQVFSTPGDGQLFSVLVEIYGLQVAEQMVPISSPPTDDDQRPIVSGYVSKPTCYKSTRQHLSFFVNRRWVLSRMLNSAVEEAYRTLLLGNRHPIAVVNIQLDPALTDVNVHPAKTEIRFLKERLIYASVMRATRQAMLDEASLPNWQPTHPAGATSAATPPVAAPAPSASKPTPEDDLADIPFDEAETPANSTAPAEPASQPRASFPRDNPWLTVTEEENGTRPTAQHRLWQSHIRPQAASTDQPASERVFNVVPDSAEEQPEAAEEVHEPPKMPTQNTSPDLASAWGSQASPPASASTTPKQPAGQDDASKFPELRVIGQLLRSYIITESTDGLVLIDQHAAHERILLERMVAAMRERAALSQLLLSPMRLELAPRELEAIEEQLPGLQSIGFAFETPHDGNLLISAVPQVLVKQLSARSLHELLSELTAPESVGHGETWEEHALANVACKAAIKANYFLTQSEMRELIDQLAQTQAPYSCCHGRPTTVQFSASALEREFGRR